MLYSDSESQAARWVYVVLSLCLHQQAKKSRIVPSNNVLDRSRAAACFGSNCLTQLLTSLAANTKNDTTLKVGIVGKHSCTSFIRWLLWCCILGFCHCGVFIFNPQVFLMWGKAVSSTAWRRSWHALLVSREASQSEWHKQWKSYSEHSCSIFWWWE